jgi:hypothetical protein
METVILTNGDEVPRVMVDTTMLSLRILMAENPVAFYEMMAASRDREHSLFGNCSIVLGTYGLIQSADQTGRVTIHDATRSVVLSAVSGEGFDMSLGEPVAVTR